MRWSPSWASSIRTGRISRRPSRFCWRIRLILIARSGLARGRSQLRGRARQVPLDQVGEMSAPATESEPTAVGATDVRDLVWAAAGGLNPDDRHARLSRARGQLERALGALLVARTGQQHCAELAVLLRGWDGVLTTLVRKRVSRHVESCPTCAERRRREFQPAALLSGYAGLAFLVPPAALWQRIRLTSSEPGGQAARQQITARTDRFDAATGFPLAARTARGGR